jgi:hypothetical protein
MIRRPAWLSARGGLLALAVAMTLVATPGSTQSSLEFPVKATYLYKLGPFVAWPPSAFESQSSPVKICIAGEDPFGTVLDQAVSNQRIGARPIVIERLAFVGRGSGCHILYARETPEQSIANILDVVRGEPVLTVTDGETEQARSGIVNFVIRENRVRFEVDEVAAELNGLKISSKVLDLAIRVKRKVSGPA